jgi:hypothetical protein
MDHCAICKEEINLKDLNTTLAMNDEKYMECWHDKCVKIMFISVSRDTNNIIHKNNVTGRSKALLTKCTIFHKKHYIFHIRMYNIKYTLLRQLSVHHLTKKCGAIYGPGC